MKLAADRLYDISGGLAALASQVADSFLANENPLADRIYKTLRELEADCDNLTNESEAEE